MLNHANLQKNVILYNAGGGQTKGLSTLKGLLQDVYFRLGEAMTAMSFNICGIWGLLWFLQSAWKLQRFLVLKGWNVSTLMTSGVQLRPIVDIQTQLGRDDKF